MLLNLDTLKKITFGICDLKEEDGYFNFYRFTDEEMKIYEDSGNTDFFEKAFSTSGVRLSFETDATSIELEYKLEGASSRKFSFFDVFVNGELLSTFGEEERSGKLKKNIVELPGGVKHLEVYFPWSASAKIKSVNLLGKIVRPMPRKYKTIAYGDSITQGYDARHPSCSYVSRVARELSMDVIDKGIGGEHFYPPLAKAHPSCDVDLITVAYGTNDWSHKTLSEFRKNCAEFLKALRSAYPCVKICVITPIWRGDFNQKTPMEIEHRDVHSEIYNIVKDIPDIKLICGMDFVPHDKKYYADEKVLHPNDEGFAYYASELVKELSRLSHLGITE